MARRLAILALVLPLLAGTGAVVWTGLGWPPPGLLLRYGLPPAGGPTGETRTVGITEIREDGAGNEYRAEVEFVAIAPGYVLLDRHDLACFSGDPLGRISRPLGLDAEAPHVHPVDPCRQWVVVPEGIWMARTPVYPGYVEDPADGIDPDRAEGLIPALEVLTRARDGRYRLATQAEYTFACLRSAIESDGVEIGEARGPGGEPLERDVLSPTLEEVFISGVERCRVVWTPDPADP